MKHAAQPFAEIMLGFLGFLGAKNLQDVAAICVATVTILALLPLVIWRWKALLRGTPKPARVPASDEKK